MVVAPLFSVPESGIVFFDGTVVSFMFVALFDTLLIEEWFDLRLSRRELLALTALEEVRPDRMLP